MRKAGGPHFSSMSWRIVALPRRVPKKRFFDTLIEFLDGDRDELPDGWEVEWGWRNSAKEAPWAHSDTFEEAVSHSTSGFVELMRQRLVRDRGKLDATVQRTHRKKGKAKRPRSKGGRQVRRRRRVKVPKLRQPKKPARKRKTQRR